MDIRMPDKAICDVREPETISRPVTTVVNHTGRTIDFFVHQSTGVIELKEVKEKP